jgi:serine/threonine protein kinase
MGLAAGTKLGPYQVNSALGAGGMGEVYRATDTTLNRHVAVKVLPAKFAQDAERMARFKREAQLLAALNHPHIATIHGLEESSGTYALVMELVEGETLAERLQLGALPLREALNIAVQIAEALEAAHEKGIIHRDLKPANIKITPEGTVKVLDFGLATAAEADESSYDPSKSPTISALTTTQAGMVIGTAAYMSPEQAKGKRVDRRADIWSFGVVLYEMLVGKPLFVGEIASEILANVITKEPEWAALQSKIPGAVRHLLQHCLVKEPKHRLQAIGDGRIAIEDYLAGRTVVTSEPGLATESPLLRWTTAGLLLTVIVLAGLLWRVRKILPPPVLRYSFTTGTTTGNQQLKLNLVTGPAVAISPDGTKIAYVTLVNGSSSIFMRKQNDFQPVHVSGTEDALNPVFSPDGQWLAFQSNGRLKKVPVGGGPVISIADMGDPRGISWISNDEIVYTVGTTSGLQIVNASGGTSRTLTELDPAKKERSHRWPYVLPNSKAVLFTVGSLASPDNYDDATIEAVDLRSRERKMLLQGSTAVRYLSSGYLLFFRSGVLYSVGFDPDRLAVQGTPIPVLDSISNDASTGAPHVAISDMGTLAYVSGDSGKHLVVWVDRIGKSKALEIPAASLRDIRLAPDGVSGAVVVTRGVDQDIWIYDFAHQNYSRFTFGGINITPLWSPDGKTIYYAKALEEPGAHGGVKYALMKKPADSSRDAELVTKLEWRFNLNDISPDGRLLYFSFNVSGNFSVYVMPLAPDSKPELFVSTPRGFVYAATLAPDGERIAYTSNESGRNEVYVRDLENGARWQVSTIGGVEPRWSRDGRELFFRRNTELYVVSVKTKPVLSFNAPSLLFQDVYDLRTDSAITYAVDPTAMRFLMIRSAGKFTDETEVRMVLNWRQEHDRIVQQGDK